MAMKEQAGEIISLALQGRFDVLVHGCNCFCSMGAGVARLIQEEFPEAYAADLVTSKGDRRKLGNYSHATVKRGHYTLTIVNAYTQFHFQGEPCLVDYQAIRKVFAKIREDFTGKRIAFPKIGAGLGGGDWQKIASIIGEELAGEDSTLIVYKP